MDQQEMMVWSRLLAPGKEPGWAQELLREAEDLAREYKVLGLRELHRGACEAAALLRGIAALEGTCPVPGKRSPEPRGDRNRRLRACYHRSRRLMGEFAARSAQPETGFIYRHLEQLEHRHCILIARLLGTG